MTPVVQIIATAFVLSGAGALQSTVGFAYALFATPLLLWLGMPLLKTLALVSTSSFIQATISARSLRSAIPWRTAVTAIVLRFATTALGLLLLARMATLPAVQIRGIVGFILCALVVIQWAWRAHPRPLTHLGWKVLAFSASGVLAGTCGMGGPPLVLWAMSLSWSSRATRAFLYAVFMSSIPLQIALLYFTFGDEVLSGIYYGVLLSPAVFLGTIVGFPLGNRLSKTRLRTYAYSVLLIIGVNSMVPGLLSLFYH